MVIFTLISLIKLLLQNIFRSNTTIIAKNIALKHQLAVLKRKVKRPIIYNQDRLLWVWISRIWNKIFSYYPKKILFILL